MSVTIDLRQYGANSIIRCIDGQCARQVKIWVSEDQRCCEHLFDAIEGFLLDGYLNEWLIFLEQSSDRLGELGEIGHELSIV
jgi:hypothetical protein